MLNHDLQEYERRLRDDLHAALGDEAPKVINSASKVELGEGGLWYLSLEAEIKKADGSTQSIRGAPMASGEEEASYQNLLRACMDSEARKN